jgi:hypothetical protein
MLNGKTLTKFTGNCKATELQNGKNSFFTELTGFLGQVKMANENGKLQL